MTLDFKSKLAALRAKNATTESSSTTSTTPSAPVSKPVPYHPLNAIPVDSKEADEVASNLVVSFLDQPINPASKGSGDSSSTTVARIESDASVSFADLEFFSKLQDLEAMLLVPHPRMPVILRDIHQQLSKDPELVTTLTDEQIGIIVNGLKKQTNTELSGSVAKQSKARDKKVVLDVSML